MPGSAERLDRPETRAGAAAARLFSPVQIRDLALKNRVVVSPMQTYSAPEALPTDWHLAHLARFGLGGAALVMIEATAVSPEGRSTAFDLGLWSDEQVPAFRRLAETAHATGAKIGIQLQHAGRKAATLPPWDGFGPAPLGEHGGVVAPSPIEAAPGGHRPHALDEAGMDRLLEGYRDAARRADRAGLDAVEVHMAHGYLLHSFLSPLSNRRTDGYGGSRENRMRFPLAVARSVREAWPGEKPLFCRISAVDGVDVGWSLDDSVAFARALGETGVDVVDCSSGGMNLPRREQLVPRRPGFQVPFARRLRDEAKIGTMAVGLISEPTQAEAVVAEGAADLVALGRELLLDPNWPLRARQELEPEIGWTGWPHQFGWWLERRARAGGN